MEKNKLKLNLKTALVILLGYAAHQSNPQYQLVDEANQIKPTATQHHVIERPSLRNAYSDNQVNNLEAFNRWAQAHQQRLNRSELTVKYGSVQHIPTFF